MGQLKFDEPVAIRYYYSFLNKKIQNVHFHSQVLIVVYRVSFLIQTQM